MVREGLGDNWFCRQSLKKKKRLFEPGMKRLNNVSNLHYQSIFPGAVWPSQHGTHLACISITNKVLVAFRFCLTCPHPSFTLYDLNQPVAPVVTKG